jgi:hypothetical protein
MYEETPDLVTSAKMNVLMADVPRITACRSTTVVEGDVTMYEIVEVPCALASETRSDTS